MIGIICFNSLRYAQFIYKYTKILDKENIEYEVVYWNREGDSIAQDKNWISYEKRINTFQPFYKKIFSFISFTCFMYKTILNKKYDKLIILTTQTAIPLFPLLMSKYRNKYIYDYRDITYENIGIYKFMVNKLIDTSCFTAISSRGFIDSKFLDSHNGKYVISHNCRNLDLLNLKRKPSNKIRIVYWGQVRQVQFNKKICDLFGNDDRFQIIYHGAGFHDELKKYIEIKKYKNIHITGAYYLHEIESFAENTDYILNMYENDKQQKPAMTVKFYDALKYGLPMLVTKGSYMSKIVDEYNLGLSIDLDERNVKDILINKKKDIYNGIGNNIKKMYDSVRKDDLFFEKELRRFTNFER